jgi:hypothetical protein
MPQVVSSNTREIAHTLPAMPEAPRSAFEGLALRGELKGDLQRTLSSHAQQYRAPATNDGTCPAPERHHPKPEQQNSRHLEQDGTCPAPEYFQQPRPSFVERLGNAIKDGLSRIGLTRRELPCE